MPDEAPTMTVTEAVLAVNAALKPLRSLLEVEKALNAALQIEREAHDHADDVAARRAVLAGITQEIEAARDLLAKNIRASNDVALKARQDESAVILGANTAANDIIAKAKASADTIRKDADADAQVAAKAVAIAKADVEALSTEKATLQAEVADLSEDVIAEQKKLSEIRAAIAKVTGA